MHEVRHGIGPLPTNNGVLIQGMYLARLEDTTPQKNHIAFAKFHAVQVTMGQAHFPGSTGQLRSRVLEWGGPVQFTRLQYINDQGDVTVAAPNRGPR